MSKILISGSSGFIGAALARDLAADHDVVCLSRRPTPVDGVTALRGDFSVPGELKRLTLPADIDVLVHLGAVTGGCREEDGIRVNVAGTHHLLRYLIDRGTQKFVLASSIATVGMQTVKFRPLRLPIPDEHPCLDRDGYGLSKYLMEEVTRYLVRQNDELDMINIRLASIVPDERPLTPRAPGEITEWALGSISLMRLGDAVRCFRMATEAPLKPGLRIMNAVGAQANVTPSVPAVLRAWYGLDADALDFAHYEQPGHAVDAVYDIARIRTEIGFVPTMPILDLHA